MSRLSADAAQRILDEHNCARARYNAGLLKWDWNLAADAQVHADRCGFWHASAIGKLPGGQGENLSISTGTVGTGGWVAEERVYDCKTGNCRGPPCGHWTQMIWNDTDRVGCAVQRCKNGTVDPAGKPAGWVGAELLVCRYAPPGNYRGQQPVGSTQCDQGAQNRSCGDRSRFPTVTDSGRGVGVIVGTDTVSSTQAGASKDNQSGLQVWRTREQDNVVQQALDKQVPLSIVDLKQSNGQELFPWTQSKKIVKQYTPEDIKYFMDTVAPTPEVRDKATFREVIKAMVEIEKRRKARGNIYVRADQRKLLDALPPQHLSPLLTLLQGMATFHHAPLVDRFFEQLYKGDSGALARIAAGRDEVSQDKNEQDISRAISGDRGVALDFGLLDEQEQNLSKRFAGQVSAEARAENERVRQSVEVGTAGAAENITSAYVVDATKEEAEKRASSRINMLIGFGVLLLLTVAGVAVYLAVTGKNFFDEWNRLTRGVAPRSSDSSGGGSSMVSLKNE